MAEIQEAVKFDTKKVYFFAGPHKCAGTSVEKFFAKWASDGYHAGHPKSAALQYWRWPTFDAAEEEKQYSALVQRNADVGYEKLALEAISQKFEESDNGVFLGTEEFDQVGPYKGYDALPIMKTIVEKVEVAPQDVRVILNYRAPRLDQWVSLWKHADHHYEDASYAFFMCQAHNREKDREQRKIMIGSMMNPLGAARVFLEQGWSVTILDMGGVTDAGKHIVHTIGCDVLKGACDENGDLVALRDFKPNKNELEKEFVGLNFQESKKAEKLFLNRDCAYKSVLSKYVKKGQLEILYQDTLWTSCTAPQSFYDQYIDNTEMMYSALLSQVKCVDDAEDVVLSKEMDAALAGGDVVSSNPLGDVEVSFFDAILIVALALALVALIRQRMQRGSSSSSLRQDTEMAPYPSRGGYRDDRHSDDEEVEGVFRDDTDLDDEEVSDQPPAPRKGASLSRQL